MKLATLPLALLLTGCAGLGAGGIGTSMVYIQDLTISTVAGQGCAISRGVQRDQGTDTEGSGAVSADALAQSGSLSADAKLGFALATALSSSADCEPGLVE